MYVVTDYPVCRENGGALLGRIQERRARRRLTVQWPLRVWRQDKPVLDTLTANLSSSGVFWPSPQEFPPGERLAGILEIGGPGADREPHKLMLRCELVVLRVDELSGGGFGVACRIADYSVAAL